MEMHKSNAAHAHPRPNVALRCKGLRMLRSSSELNVRPIPTPTPTGSLALSCRQLLAPCIFSSRLQLTICELATRCHSSAGHRAFGIGLLIVYGIMITAAMTVLVSTSENSASLVLNAVTVLFIADLVS